LATSPNHPRVCNDLAAFLAEHSLKLDEALSLAANALRTDPANGDSMDTLGWVQFKRDELGSAEATLKKAIALLGERPSAADPWFHLGMLYEKKGSRDAAADAYRQALHLQSDHKQAKAALEQIQKGAPQ